MLSWDMLQQLGPYAVSLFILGLWLKREIDRADAREAQNKVLQEKLEALAEKGQMLGYETKQQVQALTSIITAAGRT